MSSKEKIDQLLKWLQEEPDDPFLLYTLALEYNKADNAAEAEKMYEQLLEKHSNYTPTYYHAAVHFIKKGDLEKASTIIKLGLEKTRANGNLKAYNELLFLFDELKEK